MDAYIFPRSCSSLSQFIELSHPQVEAFNLDSGVTQPQLSLAAAAGIISRLESNGEKRNFIWTCLLTTSFELWSHVTRVQLLGLKWWSGILKRWYENQQLCIITPSPLLRQKKHWCFVYGRDVISQLCSVFLWLHLKREDVTLFILATITDLSSQKYLLRTFGAIGPWI